MMYFAFHVLNVINYRDALHAKLYSFDFFMLVVNEFVPTINYERGGQSVALCLASYGSGTHIEGCVSYKYIFSTSLEFNDIYSCDRKVWG